MHECQQHLGNSLFVVYVQNCKSEINELVTSSRYIASYFRKLYPHAGAIREVRTRRFYNQGTVYTYRLFFFILICVTISYIYINILWQFFSILNHLQFYNSRSRSQFTLYPISWFSYITLHVQFASFFMAITITIGLY
jgi:hypothetical protein